MSLGVEFIDITKALAKASAALPVGQMVQTEAFSLFEAMSAVEIGNPKMDAAASATPLSVDQLIADGAAPVDLSNDQVLAVIDRLLAMEATWHHGAALAQTVYTSLYMLQPDRLEGSCPLLAAYVRGVAATCSAVRWLVLNGAVSEEEDFNILAMGLPLEETPPPPGGARDEAAVAALGAALDKLKAAAKAAGTGAPPALAALQHRLALRRELLLSLMELRKKSVAGLGAAGRHLTAAQAALGHMSPATTAAAATTTGDAATPAPSPAADGAAATSSSSSASDAALGFAEGATRHLLGPAPPRQVKVLAWPDTLAHFRALLEHLQAAVAAVEVKGYRALVAHVEGYARLRANVVARSAAHYLIAGKAWASAAQAAPVDGVAGSAQGPAPAWCLEREAVCDACALPAQHGAGEDVEVFLEQATIAAGNWCQAMLLNPSRTRRRLRRGLEDWGNLYQHALNADNSEGLQKLMAARGWSWTPEPGAEEGEVDLQGPLGTWVVAETARSMLGHLQMGFELSLYEPHEYAMLFWYQHHLYTAWAAALKALHGVKAPVGAALPALPAKGGKGAKKAPPPPPALNAATAKRQAALLAEAACAEVHAHVCSALVRLCLGLGQAGLLPPFSPPFSGEAERYEQRFGAFPRFGVQRPEPVPYDTYRAVTDTGGLSATQLLMLCAEALAMSKRVYSQLGQAVDQVTKEPLLAALSEQARGSLAVLERVAAGNAIAAALVARALPHPQPPADGGAAGETAPAAQPAKPAISVSFEFGAHPVMPTLKVKSAPAAAPKS